MEHIDILKFVLAGILAFLPVILWFKIIRKTDETRYVKIARWVFVGGCLSVFVIFALQYFWTWFQGEDIGSFLMHSIQNEHVGFIVMFAVLGAVEEIV